MYWLPAKIRLFAGEIKPDNKGEVMIRSLVLGVVLSLSGVMAGAEETPAERMDRLEKELKELKEQQKAKDGKADPLKEKIETDERGRVTALTRIVNRTRVGGYFDLEFEDFRHSNSEFDNHHLIVQISSYLHDRLFFNSEIEYEHGAREIKVEQAYLDFLIHDAINFRGGVVIVPVGKLNMLHDSDLRDLTLRPQTEQLIIPSTWSETGVGFFGSFFLGENLTINYETYLLNGLTNDLRTSNGVRNARPSLEDDNNSDKSYCLRTEIVALDGNLTFGVAGYRGRFDDDGHDTIFLYATDLTLAIPLADPDSDGWISGPLEFRVEVARFTADESLNPAGAETPRRGQGAFAQVSFHFFPPFLRDTFFGTGFDHPTFTLVALWDGVSIDVPGEDRENHQRRLSFGLNYRPIEQVAFKVEYIDEDSDELFGNFQRDGWAASIACGF